MDLFTSTEEIRNWKPYFLIWPSILLLKNWNNLNYKNVWLWKCYVMLISMIDIAWYVLNLNMLVWIVLVVFCENVQNSHDFLFNFAVGLVREPANCATMLLIDLGRRLSVDCVLHCIKHLILWCGNFAETVPFHKITTPENYVIFLR